MIKLEKSNSSSLVFLGDISWGSKNEVHFINFPDDFFENFVVADLEGPLTDSGLSLKHKPVCFNDIHSFQKINSKLNIDLAILANNHIFDLGRDISYTKSELEKLKIDSIGVGSNLNSSSEPFIGPDFVVLSFGWEMIGCLPASKTGIGVNPIIEESILFSLRDLKKNHPSKKIIFFFHWGFELDVLPQPIHRDLALRLIDNGVDFIFGNHSHCIQGYEIYKGKPIIYGIGNFLFEQGYFFDGKLSHPEISNKLWALEIIGLDLYIHTIFFDREKATLTWQNSMKFNDLINEQSVLNLTGLNSNDFDKLYVENGRKSPFLPKYYSSNSKSINLLYTQIIKVRQKLIDFLVKIKVR